MLRLVHASCKQGQGSRLSRLLLRYSRDSCTTFSTIECQLASTSPPTSTMETNATEAAVQDEHDRLFLRKESVRAFLISLHHMTTKSFISPPKGSQSKRYRQDIGHCSGGLQAADSLISQSASEERNDVDIVEWTKADRHQSEGLDFSPGVGFPSPITAHGKSASIKIVEDSVEVHPGHCDVEQLTNEHQLARALERRDISLAFNIFECATEENQVLDLKLVRRLFFAVARLNPFPLQSLW